MQIFRLEGTFISFRIKLELKNGCEINDDIVFYV